MTSAARHDDPWDTALGHTSGRSGVDRTGPRRHIGADVQRVLDKLESLADKIEDGAGFLRDAEAEATTARVEYEIEHARKVLTSQRKNKEQREADALLGTTALYKAHLIAERKVRTSRDLLFAYREQVRAYQSISVIIREQGGKG